jgi:hypothetical protein
MLRAAGGAPVAVEPEPLARRCIDVESKRNSCERYGSSGLLIRMLRAAGGAPVAVEPANKVKFRTQLRVDVGLEVL